MKLDPLNPPSPAHCRGGEGGYIQVSGSLAGPPIPFSMVYWMRRSTSPPPAHSPAGPDPEGSPREGGSRDGAGAGTLTGSQWQITQRMTPKGSPRSGCHVSSRA